MFFSLKYISISFIKLIHNFHSFLIKPDNSCCLTGCHLDSSADILRVQLPDLHPVAVVLDAFPLLTCYNLSLPTVQTTSIHIGDHLLRAFRSTAQAAATSTDVSTAYWSVVFRRKHSAIRQYKLILVESDLLMQLKAT